MCLLKIKSKYQDKLVSRKKKHTIETLSITIPKLFALSVKRSLIVSFTKPRLVINSTAVN